MSEIPGSFYPVALPSLGIAIIHLIQDGALLPSRQLERGMEKRNAFVLQRHELIDGIAPYFPLAKT